MATEQNGKRQVLDLSKLVVRDIVLIDGREFEIRRREELSLLDQERLADIHAQSVKATGADAVRLLGQMLMQLMPDLDDETVERLPLGQMGQIIDWWVGEPAKQVPPTKPRTGAKSSRGSKRPSPAARRTAG